MKILRLVLGILMVVWFCQLGLGRVPIGDWNRIKSQPSRKYSVVFKYRADSSVQSVALAGSFNNWSPNNTPLHGPDSTGYWTITCELTEGSYFYKFVVNSTEWVSDPENPNKVDDDHQGYNSIMRVPVISNKGFPIPGKHQIDIQAISHYPAPPDLDKINNTQIHFRVLTAKDDVKKVSLVVEREQGSRHYRMQKDNRLSDGDQYTATITTYSDNIMGYYFELKDGETILYYGMNGVSTTLSQLTAFPVILSEMVWHPVPEWAKHAVWYQIFPERFRDGDTTNNVLGNRTPPWTWDWYKLLPWEKGDFYANVYERFFGGDIQGMIQEIPYLKSLGINAIYLNPMFMSPSIHGYDTMDYRHINPHFGYLKDTTPPPGETVDPATWKLTDTDRLFLRFVKECHAQGIKVIIDGVFNHTGDQFWAFKDVMENGANSPYKDWYKIKSYGPPVDYQGWYGSRQLPEIRQDENGLVPGIRDHIMNITKHWMDPYRNGNPSDGVDGWRLDVADLVAIPFWKDWCAEVRKINPDAYTVGEIWGRASDWTGPGGFDATMNYEFTKRLYRFFIDTQSPYRVNATEFDQSLHDLLSWYPYNVNYGMMNLLDSHDVERIVSALMNPNRNYHQGDSMQEEIGKHYNPAKPSPEYYQRLKLIVLFQMTFVGAPMIWNGDEVGMWGASDPSNRKPMLWKDLEPYDNPENTVNKDIFRYYQQIINLRKNHESLQTGSFETILTDDSKNIYAYARVGKERLVVVLNNSSKVQNIQLNPGFSEGSPLKTWGQNSNQKLKVLRGKINIRINPYSGIIIGKKI